MVVSSSGTFLFRRDNRLRHHGFRHGPLDIGFEGVWRISLELNETWEFIVLHYLGVWMYNRFEMRDFYVL